MIFLQKYDQHVRLEGANSSPNGRLEDAYFDCACGALRVLIGLSNHSEAGLKRILAKDNSARLLLGLPFELQYIVIPRHRHDITVLGLSLLINLAEHSTQGRASLLSNGHTNIIEAAIKLFAAGEEKIESAQGSTSSNIVGAYAVSFSLFCIQAIWSQVSHRGFLHAGYIARLLLCR